MTRNIREKEEIQTTILFILLFCLLPLVLFFLSLLPLLNNASDFFVKKLHPPNCYSSSQSPVTSYRFLQKSNTVSFVSWLFPFTLLHFISVIPSSSTNVSHAGVQP
eukprot:GHVT01055627.1.p1 GENE.GHVT01055627.1~~GHVT01055627.1.p1  ORF type:complete len:106 (-),score=0.44 GHVT01055627.1:70-387(-)